MKRMLILYIFTLTTVIANMTHYASFDTSGESCVRLSSDRSKLVTFSKNRVDVWDAKNLELLSTIKSNRSARGCKLSLDDKYFFIYSHETIFMYNLSTATLEKKFQAPKRTLIFTMSISEDGKYINTVEVRHIDGSYGNKTIYRYNIDNKKVKKMFDIKKRSASYFLEKDLMYVYDGVQKKAYTYDILTKKRTAAKYEDYNKNRLSTSRSGVCTKENPVLNRCVLDGDILYQIRKGLTRTDFKDTSSKEPTLSYIKSKPLRELNSFELAVKGSTVIQKSFNIYSSWDIKNGRLNWVNDLKLNMSVEDGYSTTKGIAYFNKKDHVLITPPFGGVYGEPGKRHGGIMDFDLKDGSFTNLDVAYTGPIALSKDDKLLAIRNHDKQVYFYKTQDYSLLTKSEVKKYKKQIAECNEILDKKYKLRDIFSSRKRYYEIEDKKYNYTIHKDGTAVKSEIYSGKVVAKKKLGERRARLSMILDGKVLLTENRKYFTLYRSKDFKELAKFYSFKNDEWLVLTPEGYFNASSQNIMGNLLELLNKPESMKVKNKLLQKYFRPDIVSALLQEKSIKKLQNQKNTYKLLVRSFDDSASMKNIYAGILKSRNYRELYKLRKYQSPEIMKLAQEMIKKARSKKEYKISYDLLSQYEFKLQEEFIKDRVSKLETSSYEIAGLIRSICKNRDENAKIYIKKLEKDPKVTTEMELNIARYLQAKDFANNEQFLWKIWKEQGYVSAHALKYLRLLDSVKAEKYLKVSKKAQDKNSIERIEFLYAEKLKTKKAVGFYEMRNLFKKLIDGNISSSSISKISMKEVESFYKKDDLAPRNVDTYIRYIFKYGSAQEKEKTAKYMRKAIESYATPSSRWSKFDFGKIIQNYDKYDHEYVVKTLIKYSNPKYKEMHYHVFSTMRSIQDEAFVPILLEHLDIDKRIMNSDVLGALLRYDEDVIMLTVQELNKVKKCSDIRSVERINSEIESKVSRENFKLYRCGNE